MTNDILKFELPKDQSSIIKVFGVGGGGCNAVKHMYEQGIKGVDFIVCNTDAQSLETNPVPYKIQIGKKGLGAGSVPSVGKEAAMEDIEKLKEALATNTEMVFITAGMGGGTGTGAAPVLAELAREMGILTVGIVTLPFGFEGRKRRGYADEGINELKEHVDALLVICNDKLRELYGNLKVTEAFSKADNILTTAAKSIAEIITNEGSINVDLEDVKTVMRESGVAIMGSGRASGEDRARKAVEEALSSPLLNDSNITGAKNILLYLAYGADEHAELSMDEITEITDFVNDEAGAEANVIWGHGIDDSLGSDISVTIIATGFKALEDLTLNATVNKSAIVHPLKVAAPEKEIVQHSVNVPLTNIEMVQKVSNEPSPEYEISSVASVPVNNTTIVHNLFDEPISTPTSSIENELTPMLKVSTESAQESVREQKTSIEIPKDDYPEPSASVHTTRIEVMRKYSNMIRTEEGLSAIENVPAYMRKGIQLNDPIPASEMQSSSLSISQTSGNQTVIDRKNKYLFDNVD